jgi:hypothetical protein
MRKLTEIMHLEDEDLDNTLNELMNINKTFENCLTLQAIFMEYK